MNAQRMMGTWGRCQVSGMHQRLHRKKFLTLMKTGDANHDHSASLQCRKRLFAMPQLIALGLTLQSFCQYPTAQLCSNCHVKQASLRPMLFLR